MNFTIFLNFSEFYFDFLIFNLIKKMRVHVASPCGQARAPTWRGDDVVLTWARYIFTLYICV